MADDKGKILTGYWESERRAVAILRKDWKSRVKLPPLFLGPEPEEPFVRIEKAPLSEYGRMAHYYVRQDTITFLIDPLEEPKRELGREAVYVVGSFNGWEAARGHDAWRMHREVLHGKDALVLHVPRLRIRKHLEPGGALPTFKFMTGNGDWLPVATSAPNLTYDPMGHANYELRLNQTGHHVFYLHISKTRKITGDEALVWDDGHHRESHPLPPTSKLLEVESDLPLGVRFEGDATVFRVFAPRATRVEVRYYEEPDGPQENQRLKRVDSGVWEAVVPRYLDGFFYHYQVHGRNLDGSRHFNPSFRVLDPYAVAAAGARGPGIIRDLRGVDRPGPDRRFQPPHWHDLVVLECHLADLVEQSPYKEPGDHRPLYRHLEAMLRDRGSYLRTLGVNAIELQPMQQSDRQSAEEYHWGYMTTNFFSPEFAYASDPLAGTQVEEFQAVVKAAHDAGLAVIIDVVYNHVGEPAHLLFLDKYYYFETDQYFNLLNWSGCGNDLRCNAPMARRLIIDSLLHWVRLFDVDGFRFDLAELIGAEVLKDIQVALKAEKPSLILIAEPWSFRGHIAYDLRRTAYASWNDGYRNFLREYVRGEGNQDGIIYFLSGSRETIASWPAQTVNYVESHDDRTWIDVITENPDHNGHHPREVDRRRTHLMMSILMMSYGIPMLSAGMDFLRSKHGVNNTYQRGDLNALDYQRLLYYTHTHAYFRRWIALRRGRWGKLLRLPAFPEPAFLRFTTVDGYSALAVLFNADGSQGPEQLLYAVNPHLEPVSFTFDPSLDPAGFVQIADSERVDADGLQSACIGLKADGFTLPGVSCALWGRS